APWSRNPVTYTSHTPLSLDAYASHRPLGESCPNIGPVGDSMSGNGSRTPERGTPDRGKAQMSLILGSNRVNRRNRPSRDQCRGVANVGRLRSSSSGAAPLDAFTKISDLPLRREANDTRRPSGDHTGAASSCGSNVKRRVPVPSVSISQTSLVAVAES